MLDTKKTQGSDAEPTLLSTILLEYANVTTKLADHLLAIGSDGYQPSIVDIEALDQITVAIQDMENSLYVIDIIKNQQSPVNSK